MNSSQPRLLLLLISDRSRGSCKWPGQREISKLRHVYLQYIAIYSLSISTKNPVAFHVPFAMLDYTVYSVFYSYLDSEPSAEHTYLVTSIAYAVLHESRLYRNDFYSYSCRKSLQLSPNEVFHFFAVTTPEYECHLNRVSVVPMYIVPPQKSYEYRFYFFLVFHRGDRQIGLLLRLSDLYCLRLAVTNNDMVR